MSVMKGANLSNIKAENTSFAAADLSAADLTGSAFEICDFSHAKLVQARAGNSSWHVTPMVGVQAQQSIWDGAQLELCDFSHASIDEASFRNATIKLCNLHKLSEEKTIWDGANFNDTFRTDPIREKAENWQPPA